MPRGYGIIQYSHRASKERIYGAEEVPTGEYDSKAVISVLPMPIMYPALIKAVIEGMTAGAVFGGGDFYI